MAVNFVRLVLFTAAFMIVLPSGDLLPNLAAAKKRSRSRAKPAATKKAPLFKTIKPIKTIKTIKATAMPDAAKKREDTSAILEKAKALYEGLEYADVIPLARRVLAREDSTIEQRLDAYFLEGSCLAIVGSAVDAEKPFRFLLRGRPDYDMSPETPPKILAIFRKVQVEERSIVQQMAELKRARIIKELRVEADVPETGTGGVPLLFEYRLRDPGRAVSKMNVHYRRSSSEPYSALALQIDDTGAWTAEIPGEWTENESGFSLEYYVTTADVEGVDLIKLGNGSSPLQIAMEPGSVADARPIYKSTWFWAATAGLVAMLGAGSYVLYDQATKLPETDGRIDL